MDRPGLSALRRPLHPGITLLLSPDEPPAGPSIRPGPGHQQDLAAEDSLQDRTVCRAFSSADLPGIGHRRQPAAAGVASAEILRRLLVLDYVLEHPGLPWLPTETEKVRAFDWNSKLGSTATRR